MEASCWWKITVIDGLPIHWIHLMWSVYGELSGTYGQQYWERLFLRWEMVGRCLSGKTFGWPIWPTHVPLQHTYTDLLILCQKKEALVGEAWSSQEWNLSVRRYLNDWEVSRVADFYNTVAQFKGTFEAEDSMWWQGDSQGKFFVKIAYRELNIINNQENCWPWKIIWKIKIPYKVAYFSWLLTCWPKR